MNDTIKKYFLNGWRIFVLFATAFGVLGAAQDVFKGSSSIWASIILCAVFIFFLFVVLVLLKIDANIAKVTYVKSKKRAEYDAGRDDVVTTLVELLRKSQSSLYYFGGIGFIGDARPWKEEFKKKLNTPGFTVNRLIDLKTVDEMEDLLRGTDLKGDELSAAIDKYARWLNIHAKNVNSLYNHLYDFDGAPIWKYSIHFIIFDKKDIAILFPTTDFIPHAIVIEDCKQKAEGLCESIDMLIKFLDKKPLDCQQIFEKSRKIPESDAIELRKRRTFNWKAPLCAVLLFVVLGIVYTRALPAALAGLLTIKTVTIVVLVPAGILISLRLYAMNRRSARVEYIKDGEFVVAEMIALLRKSESSICYFGGLGFIGDSRLWKDVLKDKLQIQGYNVSRLIDLKKPSEMKKLLEHARLGEVQRKEMTEKYINWLKMHAEHVENVDNDFYDFDGAPIWKYSIHFIIFDRKDIAIVFPRAGFVPSAILMKDCPEEAEALCRSMKMLIDFLNKKPLRSEDILEICNQT